MNFQAIRSARAALAVVVVSGFTSCADPSPGAETLADSLTLVATGAVWTSAVNVTVQGASLKKTGGQNQYDDAGAVTSQQLASGDGYVEFTASETNTLRCLGLHPGTTRATCATLAFALRLQSGILEVRERGVWRTDSRFVTGDTLRIALTSGVVRYSKNGVILYQSQVAPTYPLTAMAALIDSGATLSNVRVTFGDTTPPVISNVVVTPTANSATIVWTTDEPATSQIGSSLQALNYSWSGVDAALTTGHSMSLTGLQPGTLYHFRIATYDAAGNFILSTDATFTTLSPTSHHRCGWLFTSDARALDSFLSNTAYFDAIHPVWYALNSDGVTLRALADADDPTFTSAASQSHVQLIPLVASVDDVTFTRTMLRSSANQSAHIAALVSLAVTHDYAGLELDYEHLWDVADHAPLISFVQAFAAAMHAAGKVASMAIPPLPDASTVWTYPDLVVLDQAHIMGYDFHTLGTHAGPTAPLAWLDAVATRAAATGHPERFLLGLPNYGVAPNGSCQLADCAALCTSTIATTSNHMQSCSYGPYYTANERMLNCSSNMGQLYFDDASSLAIRASNAKSHGLGGVGYWNLGGEPAGFFDAIKGIY